MKQPPPRGDRAVTPTKGAQTTQRMPVLPLLSLLLLGSLIAQGIPSVRRSLVLASVFVATLVAYVTEILGHLHLLTPLALGCVWTAVTVSLGLLALRRRSLGRLVPTSARSLWLAAVVTILALPILVTAVVWPPNNYDCMVYHLPRVCEWAQNASVAHFPTSVARQLYQPPLLEYLLLHLKLLGAPASAFNVLAVLILVGAALAASLIAEQLSPSRWAGVLAAAFILTLPSAVLAGSNPKNDILVGYWCLALITLLLGHAGPGRRTTLVAAALVTGLAILTKGTGWIFIPAILLSFLCVGMAGGIPRVPAAGIRWIAFGLLVAGLGALPHHLRNLETFGNPLGLGKAMGEPAYGNGAHTPGVAASSILRNLAIELQTPWPGVNRVSQDAVVRLHRLMDLDVDDARTTWPGTTFDVTAASSTHEDLVRNPVATVMVIGALVAVLLVARLRRTGGHLFLALCTVAAFVGFCVLLKWQPWHSRLHIPVYFMGLPLGAAVLADLGLGSWNLVAIGCLAVAAVRLAWHNESRPLGILLEPHRPTQVERLFQNNQPLLDDYREATDRILLDQPRSLGLVFGVDTWEFPVWQLLAPGLPRMRIGHLGDGLHGPKPAGPAPDEIVVDASQAALVDTWIGRGYHLDYANGSLSLLRSGSRLAADNAPARRAATIQYLGANWYAEEADANARWRWTRGDVCFRVLTTPSAQARVVLRFALVSYTRARFVRLTDESGAQLWAGDCPPGARTEVVVHCRASSAAGGGFRLHSDAAPEVPGTGDSRALAFAVFDLKSEFAGP